MSESKVISDTAQLVTRQTLVRDLRELGVEPGMTLLVHASLSSLGWVCGGAQAVVMALQDAVGSGGTLVMPAHTSGLSDPAQWSNPPVPEAWWPTIREQMPAFDQRLTPTRSMGAIAELFRTLPGVLRSSHPHHSFAAIGPNAQALTDNHQLEFGLGEGSPLARIYELDGHVLLLGVGHDSNTSLHLAEYRVKPAVNKMIRESGPVVSQGQREWVEFDNLDLNSDDFEQLGQSFAQQSSQSQATVGTQSVGAAQSQLMSQPAIVDFAVKWLGENR